MYKPRYYIFAKSYKYICTWFPTYSDEKFNRIVLRRTWKKQSRYDEMSLKSFEITFFFYFDIQTPVFISMYVSIIRFHALNFNASFTIDIPGILQLKVEEFIWTWVRAPGAHISMSSAYAYFTKRKLCSVKQTSKHIIEVESTALITAVNLFEKWKDPPLCLFWSYCE